MPIIGCGLGSQFNGNIVLQESKQVVQIQSPHHKADIAAIISIINN